MHVARARVLVVLVALLGFVDSVIEYDASSLNTNTTVTAASSNTTATSASANTTATPKPYYDPTLHVNVILDITGAWKDADFTTVQTALAKLAGGLGWAYDNSTTFTLLGAKTLPYAGIAIAPRDGCTNDTSCKTAIDKVTKTSNTGEVQLSWPARTMQSIIAPALPAVGCVSTYTRFQGLIFIVTGTVPGPDSFDFGPTSDSIDFLLSGYNMRPTFYVVGDSTTTEYKKNVANAKLLIGNRGDVIGTTVANIGANFTTYVKELKTKTSCLPPTTTTTTTTTTGPTMNTTTVASNTTTLASNTTTLASNTTTVASNTTTVASNTTTVASNTTTVASNTTTVASNTTTVASNTTTVASNTTTVASNTTTPMMNTTTVASNTTTPMMNTTTVASNTTTPMMNTTTVPMNTTTKPSDENVNFWWF